MFPREYLFKRMSANHAAESPVNDLLFCNQLYKFKKINTDIGDVAISKLERHLWYLGPELVPLALFSDNLT
jgi:hypothetical protein